MQVRGEQLYAMVSAAVSAGDGVTYDLMAPQPPALPLQPASATGVGSVSNPMLDMLEFLRRSVTYITTPSTTIVSGTGASSVAITLGLVAPSGIQGMFQGWPFSVSAAGTLSGSPTSACSTTSGQIRKVLVTLGLSALPVASSMALNGGTVQFVYGSAFATSANAVTSGGQTISYFDYVPLPRPSAGEIPIGWINVVNSTLLSVAGIVNSCMITDYRATQGLNMSAMLQGLLQP